MAKHAKEPADYILPININGLKGRMLKLPPPTGGKRELMFVYGHHSSIERWLGVAEYFNRHGGVTIPDLPGFGGMDPFYKIGQKPSLDNMADYLADFIKYRYPKQKFSLVGLSLGFMIATRMLQRHPELSERIDFLISFAGFTNRKDFSYKKRVYYTFRFLTAFFSMRLPAAFLKRFVFVEPLIRLAYAVFEPLIVSKDNTKIRGATKQQRNERIDVEVNLWQCNDVRTYMDIAHTMFTLEMSGTQIRHSVYHLALEGDRYFDNSKVEKSMRQIYSDFRMIKAKVPAHSPSTIADAEEAAPYVQPFEHLLKKMK